MIIGAIRYIDPFNEEILSFDGKKFNVEVTDKNITGSRVSYNDIILYSFKISTSSSEEEIANSVEIKMYEDAGLDIDKKYKISYIKKELDYEETYLVEAFALEVDKIKERLDRVVEKTSFLDYVAIPFLSFTTLYTNKIIAPKSDLFVYFGVHESFLAIYNNGKYISTKSLINFNDMSKRLENAGVEISPTDLKEHLVLKGLDPTLYERGETTLFNELENIFSEIFTKINDVVIYNRSVFGFEKIERIFLSMQNGRIKGLKEFMQNFGFSEVKIHDFNLFGEKAEENLFSRIVASYVYDETKEAHTLHNLSIYPRKAPFFRREVGQILLAGSIVLVGFLGYLGYLYTQIATLEVEQQELEIKYNQVLKNYKRYNEEVTKLQTELAQISKERTQYTERFNNISKSVNTIEKINSNQRDYIGFLDDVTKVLNKYELSTTKIEQIADSTMIIDIIARNSQRENIAKFMIELLDKGYVSTTTEEIKSDKDVCLSKIEVKR